MREDNSGAEQYQIKELLKYRIKNGIQQLLICWEGYSITQSTWQPYRNIYPFPGLTEQYQKLKSEYDSKKRPRSITKIKRKPIFQVQSSVSSDSQSQKQQQFMMSKKKSKKIRKGFRAKKDLLPISSSQANRLQQQLQDHSNVSRPQLQDNRQIIRQQSLDQILNRVPSTKFVIKIPTYKDIPCLGQKLKCINRCFKHERIVFYEVEVDNQNFLEPLILSQNYIRVLWPRQFAEYLLEKTRIQ